MKLCAILGIFAIYVGGCSSKDDSLATVSDFCTAWGKAACTQIAITRCSGKAPTADSTAACAEQQRTFCETLVVPSTGYSSAQANTCLSAVGKAYEDGTLTAVEIATVRHLGDPCNHLIKGPKSKGESCLVDNDCDTVNNVQCVLKNGVGTCAVPTVVGNGTSCEAPGASCMLGFYCGGSDANCIQTKAESAKCTANYECEAGLDCAGLDPANDATTGTCTARVNQKACTKDDDCTTSVCDLASGSSAGLCVDSVTLASTSGICDDLR